MLKMARHAQELTGSKRLVLAGGVALNCVGNGKLLREGPFEDLWIQPAAGDAGGALGAALFTHHQLLGGERRADGRRDSQRGSLLGPSFSDAEIAALLAREGIDALRFDDLGSLAERVAELLVEQQAIGWFRVGWSSGASPGGPLDHRRPRSPEMQSRLNRKVKFPRVVQALRPRCAA